MLKWLTATTVGKIIITFLISMVPVVELRGGLPYGISLGLPYSVALAASVLGNLVPVPFIILFIRKIFGWMKKLHVLGKLASRIETTGREKGEKISRYGTIGLCLLVAIPLPGTGAWTGALAAAMLDIRLKRAIPSIILGVLIAAGIITMVTYGVIAVV